MPPVKLTWLDGRLMPPRPRDLEPGRRLDGNGAIFLGDKGTIIHGSHGAGGLRIVPEAKMKAYKRPQKTISRVNRGQSGHEQDWVRACKDGKPASSSFEYGGPLTEMVLLGVLAMRLKDQPLKWDPVNLKVTNVGKYRSGNSSFLTIVFCVLKGLTVSCPSTKGARSRKTQGASLVNRYTASTSGFSSASPCQIPTSHLRETISLSRLNCLLTRDSGRPRGHIF